MNQYHQNYGYDLEAALAKHSIKELGTPQYKEDLLNSLKKGNIQSVTFMKQGTEVKQFIEANPHFKTINIYDANLMRINHRVDKDQKQSESNEKVIAKNSKQQDSDTEPERAEKKENTRRRKVSRSV
ncbi:hypothetical protein CFS9_38960 [Flavobacterium sp. CFS9]|uniref:Uncharacterized protein n=1 Tax=Flavobacterium sp. CFS9 TaxID=3143118 RepID=A0AAT9H6C0_9FLAO